MLRACPQPDFTTRKSQKLIGEQLEPRRLLYATSGLAWSDLDVSFSFALDGASVGGSSNVLFEKFDAVAPRHVWQREFARALQTWANASTLNLRQVDDDGSASGTSGSAQGDPRFGDIRLMSYPFGTNIAEAYQPYNSAIGGDIFINSGYTYKIGQLYDFFSVSLHESGHSFGLRHTGGTVMNSNYSGTLTGLTPDDIAGIQSIYGARPDDPFEQDGPNDSIISAHSLTLDSSGAVLVQADLRTLEDVDYFEVVAPAGLDGTLEVTVDVDQLSLLAPLIQVFDSTGQLVGWANSAMSHGRDLSQPSVTALTPIISQPGVMNYDASGQFVFSTFTSSHGKSATVRLAGVPDGEKFYLAVDGSTSDEFGMGAYNLDIRFASGTEPPQPPPSILPDGLEQNDSFAEATNLGTINNTTVNALTLDDSTDVDYFRLEPRKSSMFRVSAALSAPNDATITIFDAQQNQLAKSTTGTLDMWLDSANQYFARINSDFGDVSAYDFIFAKLAN